jgi:hypothetical protein
MNKLFSTSTPPPGKYEIFQSVDTNIDTVIFEDMVRDNPLTQQGIKINHKVYRLIFFEKSPSNLTYVFDKDTIIKFYFEETIIIHIVCPKFRMDICKIWTPLSGIIQWREDFKELNYINAISIKN